MIQFFQKVCTSVVCILCFVGMQISITSMNQAYAQPVAVSATSYTVNAVIAESEEA